MALRMMLLVAACAVLVLNAARAEDQAPPAGGGAGAAPSETVAPDAGIAAPTPPVAPPPTSRKSVEERLEELRQEMEELNQNLSNGRAALEAYIDLTASISSTEAQLDELRGGCAVLRDLVDTGGPMKKKKERQFKRCVDNMAYVESALAAANSQIDYIESQVKEIKQIISESKTSKDTIDNQFKALDKADELTGKLSRYMKNADHTLDYARRIGQ